MCEGESTRDRKVPRPAGLITRKGRARWNSPGFWADHVFVTCDDHAKVTCDLCREALSASIDGEEMPAEWAAVERHLRECSGCRTWQAAAESVTRSLRVMPAGDVPDLTEHILAEAEPVVATSAPSGRIPLAVVGALQTLLGLAQLAGVDHTSHVASAGASHLFNESAAWNIALGLGFLVAAARPALARGLLPALVAFVALLTVVSVIDIVAGNVDQARLVSHSLVVIGLILLFLVDRRQRRDPRRDSITTATPDNETAALPSRPGLTVARDDGREDTRRRRPTGSRHAA